MGGTFRRSVSAAALVTLGILGTSTAPSSAHAQDNGASVELMKQGEELFVTNCRQCHGMKGTAGTPLANNAKLADAQYIAQTIVAGRGYMTAFGDFLDDAQVAAISTFVRNSWGNAHGAVTPEDVAKVR